MKLIGHSCLAALILGCSPPAKGQAQAAVPGTQTASNHVLQLDGQDSYVELPPESFTNFTEATIECWVKWDAFVDASRVFDFGFRSNETYLCNADTGATLKFLISAPDQTRHRIEVPGRLQLDEWCHLAVVTGQGGAKLYFNGALVGTNRYAGSLSTLGFGHNYLGKENYRFPATNTFRGLMDEFRVWRVARSAEQIRSTMFSQLTGSEEGLAGLWNFEKVENGIVQDVSPGAHHGALAGNAQVIASPLPTPEELLATERAKVGPLRTPMPPEAPGTEPVLSFDGNGSYVELPPNLLSGLEEATIEGWVRWSHFRGWQRFCTLGEGEKRLVIINRDATNELLLTIDQRVTGGFLGQGVGVPNALQAGQWVHIAAVFSRKGMQLYVNGVLSDSNAKGLLSLIPRDTENALGGAWGGRESLSGQMDEVRLWKAARTQAQILTNMFRKLTGKEPGLIGLWNFDQVDNGVVKDLSPGAHHGKIVGGARVALARLPQAGDLPALAPVMEFDGTSGFVELPPNIFNTLQEATIEGWVRWRQFNSSWSRFFDYGTRLSDLLIGTRDASGTLDSGLLDAAGQWHSDSVTGLRAGEWYHVCAVTGPGGKKLYLNGDLVATNAFTGSFASLKNGDHGRLGGSFDFGGQDYFTGQMREVRVWNVARTQDQIRRSMFQHLSGKEPGLEACWPLTDGTAQDVAPHAHHGQLKGGVLLGYAPPPEPASLAHFATLAGTVTDASGKRLRNAEVRLFAPDGTSQTGETDLAGEYRLAFSPGPKPRAVQARLQNQDEVLVARATNRFEQPGLHTLNFVLRPPSGLFGRALSADGRPRPGVRMRLEQTAGGRVVASTVSNARGEYAFRDIKPGAYRVSAAGPDGKIYGQEGAAIEVAADTPLAQVDMRFPVAASAPASAQPKPNRMLQLDGRGGHVLLPAGIFDDLDEATIEGWVRWEEVKDDWPGFYLYGHHSGTGRRLFMTGATLPGFQANISQAKEGFHGWWLKDLLRTDQWHHLALVTGKGGLKLFFNGQWLETLPATESFSSLKGSTFHVLGWSTWGQKATFHGQMDEVRVWAVARTEEQIREAMFQRLTGQEEGLAALWNFDAGDARDATANGFDGELRQGAQTVEMPLPTWAELRVPAVLAGRVTDAEGNFISGTWVQLLGGGRLLREAFSGSRGEYRIWLFPSNQVCSLTASVGDLNFRLTNFALRPGTTNLDVVLRRVPSLSGKVVARDGSALGGVVVQAVGETIPIEVSFDGFDGEYFNFDPAGAGGARFPEWPLVLEPFLKRKESEINFPFRLGGPSLGRGKQNGKFFARWIGKFRLSRAGRFQFQLGVEDAGRAFLDKKLVMDAGAVGTWRYVNSEPTLLQAGEHELRVEYYHEAGRHGCQLQWREEGSAPLMTIFPEMKPVLESARTDAKGEYRFPQLPDGRYRVRAHIPGAHVFAAEGKTLLVESGRQTGGVDLELAPFKKGTWRTYTRLDGLPHDQVTALHQTKDGAFWLATWGGGVARWDGRRFVSHTKADGLADNFVWSICEDGAGSLWFGTRAGVSRWNGKEFFNLTDKDEVAGTSDTVLVDKDGLVWIGTSQGLRRWDGRQLTTYTTAHGLPFNVVNSMTQTRDGTLWLGTYAGAARRDGTNFVPLSANNRLPTPSVTALYPARDGALWIGTQQGAARWDGTNLLTFTRSEGFADDIVLSIFEDEQGAVWLGTKNSGAFRWDGKSFVNWTTSDGLPENRIHAIHQDASGSMWFGTWGGGLSRWDGDGLINFSKADGMGGADVSGLQEDASGDLWIGTRDRGLVRWDGERFVNYTSANGLPHNVVANVHRDSKGIIWVGTADGLVRWDGGRFQTLSQADGLGASQINFIHEDRQGQLWVATGAGVSRWDGRRFENYTLADGLVRGDPQAIVEDRQGRLWITGRGMEISRWDGQRFSRFTVGGTGSEGNEIKCILAGNDDNIWLGLNVGGLLKLHGTNQVQYTPANGLAGSYGTSLFQDADGVLWVGQRGKVSLFDGAAWSTLTLEHGQAGSGSATVTAFTQGRDGRIWIGTGDGLYRYQKSKPLLRRPNLIVTAEKEYPDPSKVPTLATGRRVTFDFSFTDHSTRPEKQQFRWQLLAGAPAPEQLGLNGPWSKPGKETHVDWSTNQPGTYTFAVQYINEDLRHSEPALATLSLAQPWYQNAAIVAPTLAVNAGLVLFAISAGLRTRGRKREAARLRERIYEQEHAAKLALEAKNAELQAEMQRRQQAEQSLSLIEQPQLERFHTNGTLRPDAPSYVERRADRELLAGLARGDFCYVLTSRQMGKSSLMVRATQRLRAHGRRVATLDLTAVGTNLTPDQWYLGLLSRVGAQLGLEDALEDFWFNHSSLSPVQRFFSALRQVVLPKVGVQALACPPERATGDKLKLELQQHLVIFVDELDVVRSLPFRSDEFFAAIREQYNRRAEDAALNGLTFCLLGVATPSELIQDARTTPFNIGQRIELEDFTRDEIAPLAHGLDRSAEAAAALMDRIYYWTAGHPYLTQKLCKAVVSDPRVQNADALDKLCRGLFLTTKAMETDDNLLFARERLLRGQEALPQVLALYEQVLMGKEVKVDNSSPLLGALRLAGLVREADGALHPRNQIYEAAFNQEWVRKILAAGPR